MFKNKLTFGYVLFVGIPLLILIGTLRAGAHLSAPPAVSGDWTIEPTPNKSVAPADTTPSTMSVYQTGSDLLIALNDPRRTTVEGKLENGRIAAVSATGDRGPALRLEAALTGQPGHRFLQGLLSFEGYGACGPVPFRATKSEK